jgi:hypothetical protein
MHAKCAFFIEARKLPFFLYNITYLPTRYTRYTIPQSIRSSIAAKMSESPSPRTSDPESIVVNAAKVANTIREALQASLPVAPEQLMTVQIPGVVIDCDEAGPYWWNPRDHAETPHRLKANEARLVDGMVPLSKIMLGPTGKSVARSYAAALDMLIPEDAPIDADASAQPNTDAAKRYSSAMNYLTSIAPNSSKSVVDVYVGKQQAWTDSMNEWEKAKQAARDEAKQLHPNDVKQQQEVYDEWNRTSFRNVGPSESFSDSTSYKRLDLTGFKVQKSHASQVHGLDRERLQVQG